MSSIFLNKNILSLLIPKSFSEDTKDITKKLINNKYSINEHNTIINDTDRTIVGLLWHENIIEPLNKLNKKDSINLYINLLTNICHADYIDRITFQKQIWQFNEMSSLLKIFYNNKLFHDEKNKNQQKNNNNKEEIRFTKILTKYSTEYNNQLFIQNLCQELNLDIKDMFSFFTQLKNNYSEDDSYKLLETYEITKLDISRINRYLERFSEYKVKISKHTDEDLEKEFIQELNY